MDKRQIRSLFDRQASYYARRIHGPRQQHWRRSILELASGEVLELAVGAGANFPYYPRGVKVTGVDISKSMLDAARQGAARHGIDFEWKCADLEDLNFPDQSFDTIVSTLSLCCYENPSLMLHKMNRWGRPDGRILLIEHGISSNVAVSAMLKMLDPLLYRAYGCHHTRDILGLIRQSPIRIASVESYWLNTVHLIVASPGE